jgi:hypothetical protein
MKDIMDALDCLMSNIVDVVGVDFFQAMGTRTSEGRCK